VRFLPFFLPTVTSNRQEEYKVSLISFQPISLIFFCLVAFFSAIPYTLVRGGYAMATRKEIGERVLLRRRELGWTQHELGERVGCPYQVISRLESGRQSVLAERLAAIAGALGVSADYLLGLSDKPPPARRRHKADKQGHFWPAAIG
jgi:DNA-binding XRE family transcriptional regulator